MGAAVELDAVLADGLKRQVHAGFALHDGNVAPRLALWSFRLMLERDAHPTPSWRLLGRCLRRVAAARLRHLCLISSNGGHRRGRRWA